VDGGEWEVVDSHDPKGKEEEAQPDSSRTDFSLDADAATILAFCTLDHFSHFAL
jgi:hypothetical protein